MFQDSFNLRNRLDSEGDVTTQYHVRPQAIEESVSSALPRAAVSVLRGPKPLRPPLPRAALGDSLLFRIETNILRRLIIRLRINSPCLSLIVSCSVHRSHDSIITLRNAAMLILFI